VIFIELEIDMPYVNPVEHAARIIPHNYYDYSDNRAQAAADLRDLQAVTAAFMAGDRMADVNFWIAPSEDPANFVLCESVDPSVKGDVVEIWTYNGACHSNVDPEKEVYVSRDRLIKLGFDIPANEHPLHLLVIDNGWGK
jgi:hypothetical protein